MEVSMNRADDSGLYSYQGKDDEKMAELHALFASFLEWMVWALRMLFP